MIMDITGKSTLVTSIEETLNQLCELLSELDEPTFNKVPYRDSWTAGQLCRHVTKSMNAMTEAMGSAAKPADRDPGEKIAGLKKGFLDFTHKLKSPDFIVPEDRFYERGATIAGLREAFEAFKENVDRAELDELVEGLPMGAVTKLEILHFVLYHTERHLHQMKKIYAALRGDEMVGGND